MFYLFSTLVLVIIAAGLYFRRKVKLHIPLMLAAFVIDLSLVLIIEFQRAAVEKVASNVMAGTDYFLIFHASISLLVLVLYVLLMRSGYKIYKALYSLKLDAAQFAELRLKMQTDYLLHRNLAFAFVILRLVNFVTSLSL